MRDARSYFLLSRLVRQLERETNCPLCELPRPVHAHDCPMLEAREHLGLDDPEPAA